MPQCLSVYNVDKDIVVSEGHKIHLPEIVTVLAKITIVYIDIGPHKYTHAD
jgi:hypothetical protein